MTITLNMDLLKRWWPALVPAFLAAYHSLSPTISTWVAAHPSAAVWIAAGTIFIQTLFRSPLSASDPTLATNTNLARAIAGAKGQK